MTNVPEGAQLSDDGQWYWDGSDWQQVEGAAESSDSSAAPTEAGADAGAEATSSDAWPENLDEWTDEQKDMFFTYNDQSTPSASLDADISDVPEIDEEAGLA